MNYVAAIALFPAIFATVVLLLELIQLHALIVWGGPYTVSRWFWLTIGTSVWLQTLFVLALTGNLK